MIAAMLDDIAAQLRRDRKLQKNSPLCRVKREAVRLLQKGRMPVSPVDGITLTLTEAFTFHLPHGVCRLKLFVGTTAGGNLVLWPLLGDKRYRHLASKPLVSVPLADPNCFDALAKGLAGLDIQYTPPP